MTDAPKQIGPYRLGDLLGKGGCSQIYYAQDERDGHICALKLTKIRNTDERRRCRDEGYVLYAARHREIPRPRDFIEEPEFTAIAMELIKGLSLRKVLEYDLYVPLTITVRIGVQVCQILNHLHRLRNEHGHLLHLVQNDVKPENTMICSSGRVVLLDFGVVTYPQSFRKIMRGETVGTPRYMSPEQARGLIDQLDERSDLFSLGGMLVELVTGKHPFQNYPSTFEVLTTIAHEPEEGLQTARRLLEEHRVSKLIPVVERLIQPSPRDRFSSARELESTLQELLLELTGRSRRQRRAARQAYRAWCREIVTEFGPPLPSFDSL